MRNRIHVLIRMQEHAREVEHFRELAAKYKVMLKTQQNRISGYKSLFQNGACGALVIQELEVVEANSQAEQLFATDRLVDTPFASLLPPDQSNGQSAEDKARALTTLGPQDKRQTEQEFVRANGETFSSPVVLRSLQFRGEDCVQLLFPADPNATATPDARRSRNH